MPHPIPRAVEAELVSREHLVRLLVEQVDRTFSTEGSRKALYELGNLLRRLDESTLRALLQWQGAADEDEMREADEEDATGGKP